MSINKTNGQWADNEGRQHQKAEYYREQKRAAGKQKTYNDFVVELAGESMRQLARFLHIHQDFSDALFISIDKELIDLIEEYEEYSDEFNVAMSFALPKPHGTDNELAFWGFVLDILQREGYDESPLGEYVDEQIFRCQDPKAWRQAIRRRWDFTLEFLKGNTENKPGGILDV